MQTTVDFIDTIKNRFNLPSDYAAAKLLNIKPQSIYSYRAKREFMGEETALKVAEILDLKPGYVLACVAAERAKLADVRKAWDAVARKMSAAVLAVFIGVFAFGVVPTPAQAATVTPSDVYYVK